MFMAHIQEEALPNEYQPLQSPHSRSVQLERRCDLLPPSYASARFVQPQIQRKHWLVRSMVVWTRFLGYYLDMIAASPVPLLAKQTCHFAFHGVHLRAYVVEHWTEEDRSTEHSPHLVAQDLMVYSMDMSHETAH